MDELTEAEAIRYIELIKRIRTAQSEQFGIKSRILFLLFLQRGYHASLSSVDSSTVRVDATVWQFGRVSKTCVIACKKLDER
jgi:hypothetical protein